MEEFFLQTILLIYPATSWVTATAALPSGGYHGNPYCGTCSCLVCFAESHATSNHSSVDSMETVIYKTVIWWQFSLSLWLNFLFGGKDLVSVTEKN